MRRFGVTTRKSSPDLTMVVHLYSPDDRYDETYLRNYALLQVKDTLARLPGMGDVQLFGSGDYSMRIWLDPEKVAARGLTAGDVVRALREQNIQVAAGTLGQQPSPRGANFQVSINAQGRLIEEGEFGKVVVKTSPDGAKVLLSDLARIELGANQYALRSLLDNKRAVAIPVFQAPGSNALALSDSVRKTMKELSKNFPEGVTYSIVYDPTRFVRASIEEVVRTLLEALALVVLVVILFLQTWRASIIPIAAVPVSLVGTLAVMHALGFSINALSLFGLVLAIGLVVDDAIVVVENVERNIALGLTPKEATRKAMDEVSGPIIAIALVLCAVFVPIGFIPGLTGQFYKRGERAPERHDLRVDGAHLPADHGRQHGPAGVSPVRAPRVPGVGGAIRELGAPPQRHLDRADVLAGGDHRRLARRQRQQHLHSDRPVRPGRAGMQERDLDRRVRQGQTRGVEEP